MNRVLLVGNLGRDPEVRYMPSGDAIANLSLATTETWKDKNGEKQEATEWHRVVFFGRLAEVCGQYLKKGSQIYVEGSLRTRKWQDKYGQERYTTEIRGERMQMLGGCAGGGTADYGDAREASGSTPKAGSGGMKPGGGFGDLDEDIPF